jgi:hypothetical protein
VDDPNPVAGRRLAARVFIDDTPVHRCPSRVTNSTTGMYCDRICGPA